MKIIMFFFLCLICLKGFGQSEKEEKFIDCVWKGYDIYPSKKDSAYYYFNKALNIAKELKYKEDVLYVYTFLLIVDGHHYELQNQKEHIEQYQKEVESITRSDSISSNDFEKYVDQSLINTGKYLYNIKNFVKSKYYFKKLLDRLSIKEVDSLDKTRLNSYLLSLNYLGLINKHSKKLDLAEAYLGRAIKICSVRKKDFPHLEKEQYNNVKLLSSIFREKNRLEDSKNLLLESIQFYEKNYNDKFKNKLVTCYFELAENFLQQDSISLADYLLLKSDQYLTNEDYFKIRQTTLRAELSTKSKDYLTAKEDYDSALIKIIEYRNTRKHEDVSGIYLRLGDLERARNQLKESVEYYQKALVSNSTSFDNASFINNPAPQDVFSKTQLLIILKKKLEVLNRQLAENYEEGNLHAATNTAKSIIATLDQLRPEFEGKLDKQFLIEQTYPAFHEMMKMAYNGYEKTKDPEYLEDAFLYMEKSKGILLLESVKNAEAISFGSVPDSILERELQYRAYITNIEKKLLEVAEVKKTVFHDSLFKLNTNYYDFLRNIEKKYPKYYQLKYDTKTTSLRELRQFIESDKTVISFHQTQKELFAFVTTKSEVKFLKIPFTVALKNDIERFYKLHSNPVEPKYGELRELGKSIYDRILVPCLKNDNNKELTIIADGLLNYIPFGALRNTKTGGYLINDRNIHYANSATLLTSAANKKDYRESNLLAISPSFDIDSEFSPLPFSKKEASLISGYFRGKTLLGKNASLENFSAIKDEYSLLHFATHASANDEEPDFSYLAFSPEDDQENRLYIKDLFNYSLNANMVTLSACESGIGKLQNGEGMLSLARGFQYAGVPSLTTTLWKNDDQSTSELMGYYYKHLKDGLTKSRALQKAKLEYLVNTEEEELRHPYYWAGFVVLGDNSPISDKPISPWVLLGCGLLGAVILLFGNRKIKARRVAA